MQVGLLRFPSFFLFMSVFTLYFLVLIVVVDRLIVVKDFFTFSDLGIRR